MRNTNLEVSRGLACEIQSVNETPQSCALGDSVRVRKPRTFGDKRRRGRGWLCQDSDSVL